MWVEFTDTWHDELCRAQGVPKPGENAKSRDVALDAQWTTAVYEPYDDGGTLKVFVTAEDAKTYGLTAVKAPVFPTFGDPKPGPPAVSKAKPVPTDPLDVAAVLVTRGIRTKEQTVELLKVDPVALDARVAQAELAEITKEP